MYALCSSCWVYLESPHSFSVRHGFSLVLILLIWESQGEPQSNKSASASLRGVLGAVIITYQTQSNYLGPEHMAGKLDSRNSYAHHKMLLNKIETKAWLCSKHLGASNYNLNSLHKQCEVIAGRGTKLTRALRGVFIHTIYKTLIRVSINESIILSLHHHLELSKYLRIDPTIVRCASFLRFHSKQSFVSQSIISVSLFVSVFYPFRVFTKPITNPAFQISSPQCSTWADCQNRFVKHRTHLL